MSSWIWKAGVQQVIGRLPYNYWWNIQLQKYVNKSYLLSRESFGTKLNLCGQHLDNLKKYNQKGEMVKALEIGTGPWPIVPIGLYLFGISEIWTYDIAPLIRKDNLKRVIELFCEVKEKGALNRILGRVDEDRFNKLKALMDGDDKEGPNKLLEKINIHIRVGDARNSKLPDHSMDFIFSTVVLEMISAEVLSGLLNKFRRLASPDNVMSHYVGLADQYASFDRSITPYNFLRYSDSRWRIYNNPIIPQNRLRVSDYRELFEKNKWQIVEERSSSGSADELAKIKVDEKFKKYSLKDLLVLYSWFIVRRL